MRLLSRVLAAVLLATVLLHSAPVEAATKPSAPRSVKATPLNKAVKVTWAAPSSPGTSAINAYAVQRRNTTSSPWVTVKYTGATARAWTETGLVNGARFYYRVMARNGSGWGTASAQVSAVPRTVPAAPRYPAADAYNAALGAYWQIPTTNGGATIDRYQVQWSADGATWTGSVTSPTASTQAAPATVPLTPGTRYWLRVRAHNAAGYGPTTGFGPYTVRTAPGPVTDLAATPGVGQVALTWTAPVVGTPVGSTAVASYKVESSADGGTTWTTEPSTTETSTIVTGLTGGVSYQFRVSARSVIDNVGYGPATVIAPDAPTGVPSAPQNVTLGWEEAVGQFRLAWQPPASDGGRDLTSYQVAWSGPNPGSFSYPADATHADLPTVPLDHQLHVRACNGPDAADCGPWSDDLGPVTDRVVDLQAAQSMAGTARTVHVDWGEPANGLATSYDVLRSDDGGTTFSPLATVLQPATEYDDTTTLASTQYIYKVVPHGGGTGEPRITSITTSVDQTLSISPTTINVTEGSSTGAQVVLGVATSVATEVTVTVADPALATTTTATVQVAAGETSAAVTLSGTQDDDLVGGSTTLTATLGALEASATVAVADNDTQAIIAPAAVEVADGATAGVDVRLLHQPTGPVTVSVGITQNGNKVDIVGDVTELQFTAANWNQPQTLQVHRNSPGAATLNLTAPGATSANVAVTEP